MATRAKSVEIDDDDISAVGTEEAETVEETTSTEGEEAESGEEEPHRLSDAEKLKRARTREKRYRAEAAEAKRIAAEAKATAEAAMERLGAVEKATVGQAKQDLQNRVTWLQQQRDTALEAGDAKTFSKFDTELRAADKQLARFEDAESRGETTRPAPRTEAQPAQISQGAKNWIAENPWFSDPANAEDAALARTIAERVKGDGFDPDDEEEFWGEVTKRCAKRGVGGATVVTRRPGSPTLASGTRSGSSPIKSGAEKIPEEARKLYEARGWDLSDPKVVSGILARHGDRFKRARAGA